MASEAQVKANRENAKKSTGPRTAQGKAVVALNAVRHGLLSSLPVLPGVEDPEDWQEHRQAVLSDLAPVGYLEVSLAERVALAIWRMGRAARWESAKATKSAGEASALGGRARQCDETERDIELLDDACRLLDATKSGSAAVVGQGVGAELAEVLLNEVARQCGFDLADASPTFPGVPDACPISEFQGWTVQIVAGAVVAIVDCVEQDLRQVRDAVAERLGRRRRIAERRIEAIQLADAEPFAGSVNGDATANFIRYEAHLERSLLRSLHELQRLQAARSGKEGPKAVDMFIEVAAHRRRVGK